jgi:type VI secretion system secreted protein Hcp
MHQPFVITKEVDKSSPLLYNALVNNENITEWELQFWSANANARTGKGAEVQDYTVKLTNANISNISFRMLNNKNPELLRYAEYEEISFTYQKISWTWNNGGIVAEDDWESPNS